MSKMYKPKVGDKVTRMISGSVLMKLTIDKIENGLIYCGDWTFDEKTGVEEDDLLEWGVKYGVTGSYLRELWKGI